MVKLTLTQLEELANWEWCKKTEDEKVLYIAYLWSMIQGLSEDIAAELERDYKKYSEQIK